MTLGKETFELTKKDYTAKLGKVIANHRANSKIIGEPRDFVLRSCRLTTQWGKLAGDPEVVVYLRNVEIAGGRKVKMLSLERGTTKQPVSKSKLIDELYPVKAIATKATTEEQHYNKVKAAMRGGVQCQLKAFRDRCELPLDCYLTGKSIRKGMRTDVDHVGKSFSEIADQFISSMGLVYADVVLTGPPTAKRFKNQDLWEQWVHYHLREARFSLVCASANRQKGASGYETPSELIGSFKAETEEDIDLDF